MSRPPARLTPPGSCPRSAGRPRPIATPCKPAWPRVQERGYRESLSQVLFDHVTASGGLALCLYYVTTLYFEAEREDDLRRVGYSKERRVDPQVIVGLLVDRYGFPLQVGCWEGGRAETATIIPVVEAFQAAHGIEELAHRRDAVSIEPERVG